MRKARFGALIALLVLIAASCRTGDEDVTTISTSLGDISVGRGIDDRTIKIGSLAALTGAIAAIGDPLQQGHEVYFEYVNDELGGVGRGLEPDERFQVELVTRDGQYISDTHVTQYRAIRDEVLAISQSLGTPTTQAILPDIRSDGLLTGAATLATDWLRERYVVPAGAPYPIQFINAADYIVNELGASPRAGIIYQDDDYGEEGLDGLEFAADAFGFEIVARATYEPTDTEFTAQVTEMQRAEADYVFLTTIPSATAPIIGTAAAAGYTPTRFVAQSPAWIGAFLDNPELIPLLEASLWIITDAACEWGDISPGCEGMAEMIQNLETYASDQEPDYYFAFGYTQARIFHQILERAVELGDLTREGMVEAFESLRDVDMGGLLNPISYGPDCEDKIPATASGIFEVDTDSPIGLGRIAVADSDAVADFPFCP